MDKKYCYIVVVIEKLPDGGFEKTIFNVYSNEESAKNEVEAQEFFVSSLGYDEYISYDIVRRSIKTEL